VRAQIQESANPVQRVASLLLLVRMNSDEQGVKKVFPGRWLVNKPVKLVV
jgi:hypothetical protein